MNQDTKTNTTSVTPVVYTPREITQAMRMWELEEGKSIRKIHKLFDRSLQELGVTEEVDFLLGIPGVFSIATPWYVNFYVTFSRKVNYFLQKSLPGFSAPPVDHERSL
jgi:hypothetical protein